MMDDIYKNILSEIEKLPVTDAHEHLLPEGYRLGCSVDIFSLFTEYAQEDLLTAGIGEQEFKKLFDRDADIDERWDIFEPYWKNIKYGCYSRAISRSVEKIYGVSEISRSTYRVISEKMKRYNEPGIYRKVLAGECGIKKVLNQCNMTGIGDDLFVSQMPMPLGHSRRDFPLPASAQDLKEPFFSPGTQVRSLDEYAQSVCGYIDRVRNEDAAGLKMTCYPYAPSERKEACEYFDGIMNGYIREIKYPNPFKDYIVDTAVSYAAKIGMPVQVHTGYWHKYDFRMTAPLNMIPLLSRHPDARFDIYHLGLPRLMDLLVLAKAYPNTWVDFCWAHIISQECAKEALSKAIDLIPMNKLILFGGDMEALQLENIYGHLSMAREDIASVLSDNIKKNNMSFDDAVITAGKWLSGNAEKLYGL